MHGDGKLDRQEFASAVLSSAYERALGRFEVMTRDGPSSKKKKHYYDLGRISKSPSQTRMRHCAC